MIGTEIGRYRIGFLSDGKWFFGNEGNDRGITESFADRCP